jgi:SAP domain
VNGTRLSYELRQLCRSANLPSSGRKADLIATLQAKDRGEMEHQASDPETSLFASLELVNEQEVQGEVLLLTRPMLLALSRCLSDLTRF